MSSNVIVPNYRQRRESLMSAMDNGVAVFRSAPMAVMHNDVEYNFRQDSDFFYLTGFDESDAVAVLSPHHEKHSFILFVQPKDPLLETWTGYRIGVDAAKEHYGADAVYPITELEQHLPGYLSPAKRLYYHFGRDRAFNDCILTHWQRFVAQYQRTGSGPIALEDPAPLLHPLRLQKDESELAQIRQAIEIAVEAHQVAQEMATPGRYEYEIQAQIEHIFRRRGAMGPAYPSIVASGPNACILHYTANRRQLTASDLLLIDAGCSCGYYNSDITRTFPVSGQFTPEQQTLYDLVLEAQRAAIAQVQPGNPYNAFHDAAVRVITEGLVNLGLLKGSVEELIEKEAYKPFYMHRTGHWLGLDVHDVGSYKTDAENWRLLSAGQVLTVEPGIYISPDIQLIEDQPPVPEQWRGIGIRIEDNVLVTASGHEVLTAALAK
jgi:Xaa-Pro aminopeptidase